MAAALAAAIALAASNAFADGENQDEITMKDGGTVRGTVVTLQPGTQVKVIEMGTTTVRVIPWSQVADVQKGKYAAKATVEPGDAGAGYGGSAPPVAHHAESSTTPEQPEAAHRVRLHIESTKPVSIMSPIATSTMVVGNLALEETVGTNVCTSPCDKDIAFNDGDMFVAHGDFPGKKTFSLANLGDSAELEVKPGSYGKRLGGIWAISGGVAILGGGVALAVVGGLQPLDSTSVYDPVSMQTTQVVTDGGQAFEIAGGCMIAGGAGIAALGIWLVATSGTKWDLHASGAPAVSHLEPWVAPPAPLFAGDRSALPRGMVGGMRGRF